MVPAEPQPELTQNKKADSSGELMIIRDNYQNSNSFESEQSSAMSAYSRFLKNKKKSDRLVKNMVVKSQSISVAQSVNNSYRREIEV